MSILPASIDEPTVGQMVELLSKLDPHALLQIRDADTGWTITTIHFAQEDGAIVLYGEYSEMISHKENAK